ncbi:uncharacterized protein LOC123400986 [Hordeum vulgare subsp. vulgare]|nr:uncharacterized protein LOC123400986 [Hordeum vulgare subsp. vulgare]
MPDEGLNAAPHGGHDYGSLVGGHKNLKDLSVDRDIVLQDVRFMSMFMPWSDTTYDGNLGIRLAKSGPIPTPSLSALQPPHEPFIHSLARSLHFFFPRSAHSTRTVHPSISASTDRPAFACVSGGGGGGGLRKGRARMEGDDKWKLSKKGRSRSGRNYYYGDASGASTSRGLSRSYSASVTATRPRDGASGSGSSSSEQQQKEEAESRWRLSKKCVEAVKEHRARFYIVRRCVSMLVCWRDD